MAVITRRIPLKKKNRRPFAAFCMILCGIALACSSGCGPRVGPGSPEVLTPAGLTVEYRTDPLGVDTPRPRLSWVLESSGRAQFQRAYQVLVADSQERLADDQGNLWDSGRVESGESLSIDYGGRSLESGRRYYWKVRVWNGGNIPSGWSRPAAWETALMDAKDWSALWIETGKPAPQKDEDFYADDPAPLFRKAFVLPAGAKRARLYVTGLGYYETSLNGRRVGDQVLDPGWTNYKKRVFYGTYDVTGMLRKGPNVIGVMVGNGWYNPLPLCMWGNLNLRESLPVGRPRLIAQLAVDLEDGARITIVTDGSWQVRGGPLLRNNVYLGEVYDARREIPGWNEPGAGDSGWTNAKLCAEPVGPLQAQPQPPIRITARFKPAKMSETAPRTYICDFGRNFGGWARLRLREPAGRAVRLRFGELLNEDGSLNPMTGVCGQIKGTNKDGAPIGGPGAPAIAEPADTYIARGGGEETYTPRFTFRGFRYVEITGLSRKPALDDLEGLRLNSDVAEVGAFSCSNERLNRIQDMTRRTFLSNIFSVQSDCPHREKFGYGGDLVATSEAFLMNFGMAGFYAKAAADWADAARPDGMLPDTAPFVGLQYCGLAWAMAHPLLQSQLFRFYGDRRVIEEQYDAARRWFELVLRDNPDFIVREGLADHESLAPTELPFLLTPLLHQCAGILSSLARTLGRDADARRYTDVADAVKAAYRGRLLGSGPAPFDSLTQAGLTAALELGLLSADERTAAREALVRKFAGASGPRLDTGIFGTRFVLNALSRAGRADLAYALVDRREFPGWGYMLERGATTLWEHWEYSDNTYSHNHPMFGSVSEWLFAWLAGIQADPGAAGFDRILIRPQPVGDLAWVKGRVLTLRGEIRSEWRRDAGLFRLEVSVPPNATATVFVPAAGQDAVTESGKPAARAEGVRFLRFEGGAAVYEIGSGRYSFAAPFGEKKNSEGSRPSFAAQSAGERQP